MLSCTVHVSDSGGLVGKQPIKEQIDCYWNQKLRILVGFRKGLPRFI